MTTSKTVKTDHRSFVALLLPSTILALIAYAQQIVKAMTGNPAFPSPVPTLAAVTAAIVDLQNAETIALTRAKGTVVNRNEKRTALVVLLHQLKGYIQTQADANIENGASIIASAGVGVKKPVVRAPRVFDAKLGPVSGTATLVAASAGHRASYEWQYSTDGGKTWVLAPVTLQTRTTVVGLPSGATVQFRYRPVTKAGEGDWSQTIVLLVK
ncbi:MAG TPA: fibronectin type III domain-containing protein [Polyangiaceae bacterium]